MTTDKTVTLRAIERANPHYRVTVRRCTATGHAELFFYNTNPRDYWLECFTRKDGHADTGLGYMRACKPVDPSHPDAVALVQHWESIGPDRATVRILKRLPRPVRTARGWQA
jgi:hypothetical protein